VLFRGFQVREPADHQVVVDVLGAKAINYTYRSTPRTQVYRDILTATEYPPQLEIPLHCENAYQRTWPSWVSLCCLVPATGGGGQTPIADLRTVTAAIQPEILDRFAQRGVKYIRHYHPRVDLPWENVFQTKDRDEVARFCREHDIHHEWLDRRILRTEQVCQGVADHPITGETVFFNQAHLFHRSSVGPKAAQDMLDLFGADRLPRDAKFGDGGEIGIGDLETVRAAFNSAANDLHWQQGDVVIIDNMRFAHGRRAYHGTRRVLAALLNPYRPR
jgi:alpha-ketoglutarate-dependent taurine dioxygenase